MLHHFVILLCAMATAAALEMAPPSGSLLRAGPAYEVEQLVLAPGDPAGLAAWAELAARGFHVVAVVPQDGKQVLFCERALAPMAQDPRLPAAVAADAAHAEPLRASLRRILAERAATGMRPLPAPAPALPAPQGKP